MSADWKPGWRDDLAVWLCNWIVRHVASEGYHRRLHAVIVHGLAAAPRREP